MTDESDEKPSVRGEAAWRQATEAIADRNRRTQKLGREQREAHERERRDSRRAAEARAHARLVGGSN